MWMWIVAIIATLWVYSRFRRWWKYSPTLQQGRRRNEALANSRSADPRVRQSAVERFDDKRDVAHLSQIALNDSASAVRVAAFTRLRRLDPQSARALVERLRSEKRSTQIAELLPVCAPSGNTKGADDIFTLCVQSLAQIADGASIAGLIDFYHYVNNGLKGTVMSAFERNPDETTAQIVRTLTADPGRTPLIRLLGTLKRPASVSFLDQLVRTAKYSHTATEALQVLSDIGTDSAMKAVAAAAHNSDARVRLKVCECLTSFGAAALPTLQQMLSDTDEGVRLSAVQAVAANVNAGVPSLQSLLQQERSEKVRFAVQIALCRSGDNSLRASLMSELVRQAQSKTFTYPQRSIDDACEVLGCSREFGLARKVINIPTTQHVCGHSSSGGGAYYRDELDPDSSVKALRELCSHQTLFATEILRLVGERQSATVSLSSCNFSTDHVVDLAQWRQIANQELLRRGVAQA